MNSSQDIIKSFRKKSIDEIALTARAMGRGAIPLSALIKLLAGEALQEAGKTASIKRLREADVEFEEGYRVVLNSAKRSILDGKLIVRQLTTLVPVNDEAGVRAWCAENDALKSSEEMRPHGRMVVKTEDARGWLGAMGIPVPQWLSSPATAKAPVAPMEARTSKEAASERGRKAANARHDKPGGAREKREEIRRIWSCGTYRTRELCAEQEFEAIGWKSPGACRKALVGTPDPDPWPAKKT